MSWRDRAIKVDTTKGSWRDRAVPVESGEILPKNSEMESGLRGAAQGASFGFADELTGLGEALYNKVQGNPGALKALYQRYRDESRGNYKQASEDNPLSFAGGEMAGGIGTLLIPGLGAAKGAQAIGKLAMRGAAEGAAFGAGASEADNIGDLLKDTAISGGTGAGISGVLGGIGKLASKGAGAAKKALASNPTEQIAKKVGNLGFDVPEEFTDQILKHGDAFKGPKSYPEIQDKLVGAAKTLKSQLLQESDAAGKLLSSEGVVPTEQFTDGIESILRNNDIDKFVDTDKEASKFAYQIRDQLSSYGDDLSPTQIKKVIKKADSLIDWQDPSRDKSNQVLKQIRSELDGFLKESNPAYSEAMGPVAEKARLLQAIQKDLNLDKNLDYSNQTLGKLQTLKKAQGDPKRMITEENLDALSAFRGEGDLSPLSLLDDLDIARVEEKSRGGVAQGSRGTLAGAIAGSYLGGPVVGTAVGGAAGYVKDKYGRAVGSSLLKKSSGAIKSSDELLRKMSSKLPSLPAASQRKIEAAMSRGANSVGATHFLLSQQDEEYRKAMRDDEEDEKEDY